MRQHGRGQGLAVVGFIQHAGHVAESGLHQAINRFANVTSVAVHGVLGLSGALHAAIHGRAPQNMSWVVLVVAIHPNSLAIHINAAVHVQP